VADNLPGDFETCATWRAIGETTPARTPESSVGDFRGLPPIVGGPRPSAGLAGDPYSAGGWGILVGSPIM
jgi:hypothetical protein